MRQRLLLVEDDPAVQHSLAETLEAEGVEVHLACTAATVVGVSPFQPRRGQRGAKGQNRSRLVLSPAGNRLAYVVSDMGRELWRMDGLSELFAKEAIGRR